MQIVWSSLILLVVVAGTIGTITRNMIGHAGFGTGTVRLVYLLVGFGIGFVWQILYPVFE